MGPGKEEIKDIFLPRARALPDSAADSCQSGKYKMVPPPLRRTNLVAPSKEQRYTFLPSLRSPDITDV